MPDTNREVYVEPSEEAATELAARLFKQAVAQAVQQRGYAYVALAGGTTPRGLYDRLAADVAADEMPWQNVHIFFGDERDVPQDHPESNYGMVQRTLLDHVPVELMHVHPMPADADELTESAALYEQTLRNDVPASPDGLPRLDLVLLGMGGDGHTASLFPRTEAVGEHGKLVMAYFVPVLGRWRMTITYPVINQARHVLLLVTGADKAGAVQRLLAGGEKPERLPAAGVDPSDGLLRIVLDTEAAKKIGPQG